MIKLVWRNRNATTSLHMSSTGSADISSPPSIITSAINLSSNTAMETIPVTEKEQANTKTTSNPRSGWRWNWRLTAKADEPQTSDPEKEGPEKREPRPTRLYAPFYCGFAVALSTCTSLLCAFSQLIFPPFQGSSGVELPSCSRSGF